MVKIPAICNLQSAWSSHHLCHSSWGRSSQQQRRGGGGGGGGGCGRDGGLLSRV